MTSCFLYIQARREAERIARIRASGEAIGGDVVVLGGGTNGGAEGGGAEEGGADTAVRTGGKTRAWDGCVARIDVSNLSKGRHTDVNDEDDDTAVRRRGRFGGLGSTHPEQKKFVLDEGNRWKTEARIAAGGTGGTAELERLRRAAQRLEENNKESGGSNSKSLLGIDREKEEDEDAPVVVAPEELTFGDDGWATTTETAETAPAILNGTQPSSLEKDLLDAEMRLKTAAEAALLDGEDAAREMAARAAREAARRERLARTLGNLPGDEELPTDGSNCIETKPKSKKRMRKKTLVSFDEED
jgi:hypothetical protein